MRAALLFSATIHIALLGFMIAAGLRMYLDARRPKEPTVPETAGLAGAIGLGVTVIATVLMWLGRPFGQALAAGLGAGAIAALAFLLALGCWPHRPANGAPMSKGSRIAAVALVGTCAGLEVIAFCFLATA